MEPGQLLEEIRAHFAQYTRPDNFIDASHCCECAEHYAELADVPVEGITKEHVGDGAWDPSTFLSADGFRYYFPGLCRIANEDRSWLDIFAPRLGLWYVDTFSEEDRLLARRMLEAWWFAPETPDSSRLAVERALDHFQPTAPPRQR